MLYLAQFNRFCADFEGNIVLFLHALHEILESHGIVPISLALDSADRYVITLNGSRPVAAWNAKTFMHFMTTLHTYFMATLFCA